MVESNTAVSQPDQGGDRPGENTHDGPGVRDPPQVQICGARVSEARWPRGVGSTHVESVFGSLG